MHFFVSRGLGLVDLGVEGLFGAWGAGFKGFEFGGFRVFLRLGFVVFFFGVRVWGRGLRSEFCAFRKFQYLHLRIRVGSLARRTELASTNSEN